MSRLPESGDAIAAVVAMNTRVEIGAQLDGNVCEQVGDLEVNLRTGEVSGDGIDVYRPVYGDLFEIGEMLQMGLRITDLFEEIAEANPDELRHVLISLYLQAVGTGVLMERARWERRS